MNYTKLKNTYFRATRNIRDLMCDNKMLDLGCIPIGIEETFCRIFAVELTDSSEIKNLEDVKAQLSKLTDDERYQWLSGKIQ